MYKKMLCPQFQCGSECLDRQVDKGERIDKYEEKGSTMLNSQHVYFKPVQI